MEKVSIKDVKGALTEFEVHGGFLSVSNNRVSPRFKP